MKHVILAALLSLPLPAFAQDDAPLDEVPQQDGDIDEGFSLMEEGAKLLFRGIIEGMEPAIDDFSALAEEMGPALDTLASEMGPALVELMRTVDSVQYYEPPEFLPNGDIILRRKPDAPEFEPPDQPAEPIDL